jgi:hypothetical protein
MNNNLINQITKTIKDSSTPLWFPDLTKELVNIGEKNIKENFELTLSEYGTNIVWYKDKKIPRNIVTEISNPLSNDSNSIQIEILDRNIVNSYKESQIRFYESDEIINAPIIDCIKEAIEIIKLVPSLLSIVFDLVRSLHLIKLDNNEYDVSFSEPYMPFSIFISVPNERVTTDNLRVSEAIIHESMHLQLSLMERMLPFVYSSDRKFYSPWKKELRKSQGILHALYVFRVIGDFYKIVESNISLETSLSFIQKRRQEISKQVNEIKDFTQSPDLTDNGRQFVKRLLDSNSQGT